MKKLLAIKTYSLALALIFSGCASTKDWNPFADLPSHDTVTVVDFESDDPALGKRFADQVASELVRLQIFRDVSRGEPDGKSIVLRGEILKYKKGNPALRLKMGPNVGNGEFAGNAWVSTYPDIQDAGRIKIFESTKQFHADASRTGRETGDWLIKEAASNVAKTLQKQIEAMN
ncbi:MAG: DUF4410 domain-containing protein [Verrucomicrobiota bacterium]